MRLFASTLTIAVSLLGGSPAVARAPVPTVAVTLDATHPGPIINRQIFGQFAEHLGHGIYEGIWVGPDSKIPNTRGIRNDVVAALRDIHVPNVRWPGGCFADEYHWRKGIGAASDRPATLNSNWGGVLEPNTFGTAEYMDFIDQIGSEAYVSTNVGSGSPQETAEWLEYMTTATPTTLQKERAANGHPAPYKVQFLGIGNESWGCGGSMSPEQYVAEYRKFATFAKNYNPDQQGDAHMLRIASGPNKDNYAFMEEVMRAWQKHIYSWDMDGVSLHTYTATETWPPSHRATGFDESEYVTVLKDTLKMEEFVSGNSNIMDKYDPTKKIALVVDEWGAWYPVEKGTNPGFLFQQNSQRDAVLATLNLNIFARHADRVRMANIAQMINVLQAMILTDGPKMVLTPTYYVYKMYVPFQDATFIPLRFEAGTYSYQTTNLPRLDAIAAKSKDGKVWLELTNLDPKQPLEVDLSTLGLTTSGVTGQTLASPKIDSVNTFDAPGTVVPTTFVAKAKGGKLVLNLPAESITVVAVDPK